MFCQIKGTTIIKAINIGIEYPERVAQSKIINEATGVDLITEIIGEIIVFATVK